MKGSSFVFILLILLIFAACVPNKRVVYLQDGIPKKKILVDSVLKSFPIVNYEYKLQPDDILSVQISSLTPSEYNFFSETARELGDQLLAGYTIDNEGNIEIPAVGQLRMQGLSVRQAEERIKEALEDFLRQPIVKVKILNFEVTLLGEVNDPGMLRSPDSKINLMEAIAMAGDLTEFADRARIKLVRHEGGEAHMIYLNTLEDGLLNSPYYYLQPNDIIVVPPLEVKNLTSISLKTFGVFLSTISAIVILVIRLDR